MTGWNHPGLIGSVDTPYGRVTLRQEAGQLSVFENDALSYETQGTDAELFVRIAALQLENPARVLILGGGISGILNEIRQHHPQQVDCVELNRRSFDAVLPHLPQEMQRGMQGSGIRLLFADPRTFLRQAAEQFDLILVGMPEPASGQTNRFYTREFFGLCAAKLAPGGVLPFRLHSAENYWSPLLAYRSASIYRALADALPHVVVVPGSTNIFLA
jgi:spermidine synthase